MYDPPVKWIMACFVAAHLLLHGSTTLARGPGGGVQSLATPSMGGGRGGSGGSSGFSFGSGGISFGGPGRISIGTGGLNFGTGGRHTPSPNFKPDRGQRPGNHGGHDGIHVIPEIEIVPQFRVPTPSHEPHWSPPSHYKPRPSYRPPPNQSPPTQTTEPTTPQVQPNELPANPAPDPVATEPQPNASGLVARQITPDEVQRARQFFRQRLLQLTEVLQQRVPPVEYDPEGVTAQMLQNSVPAKVQVKIVDALDQGDYETAKDLWKHYVPDVEIPFKPSRIRVLILRLCVMFQRGYVEYPVVREIIHTLPPEALRPSTCCGADDLLVQIEQEIRIHQAIGGDTPETPGDDGNAESFSKPRANDKPYTYTSNDTPAHGTWNKPGSFGKPGELGGSQVHGSPGGQVPIPSGPVNIVYHPKLPDRQVVVVNAGTVMIGTGGRGVFRMEHGYVAEALGQRIGRGAPLPENRSDLVRAGVVVVNPTHAKVGFVFGSHQVTLEPGYQQVLNQSGVISFDRGGDKGTARYTLEPGTYEFEVSKDGWDLHSKQYEVTVSNEGNREAFHYIVQGEQASLAPEETRTHTSDYPILIRFDRGDGSAIRQIRWKKSQGSVQVAINPADNLWDLFLSSQMETKEPTPQPTPDFVPAF